VLALAAGCSSEIGDIGTPEVPDSGLVDDVPPKPEEDAGPQPILTPCTEGAARTQTADGTCYALVLDAVTWQQAAEGCVELGSALARIDSATQQADVATLVAQGRNAGFDEIWMGGNDLADEGTFVWADNTPLTFTAYRPGQPSGGTAENCLVWDLDDQNRWDDRDCDDQTGYICKRLASLP
jgi:hypothetical protein